MSVKQINITVSTIINGKQQVIAQKYTTTNLNLEDLADVLISGANPGDLLVWNGSNWVNSSSGPSPSVGVATGLVATTGGQSGSLPVSKAISVIATCPSSGGISLPAALVGMAIRIVNNGSNTLAVFPAIGGSDLFIGQSANAALTGGIPAGGQLLFYCGLNGTIQYS